MMMMMKMSYALNPEAQNPKASILSPTPKSLNLSHKSLLPKILNLSAINALNPKSLILES